MYNVQQKRECGRKVNECDVVSVWSNWKEPPPPRDADSRIILVCNERNREIKKYVRSKEKKNEVHKRERKELTSVNLRRQTSMRQSEV